MSVDCYKSLGEFQEGSKKRGMRLNPLGFQHLSDNLAKLSSKKEVSARVVSLADYLALSSIMSLWRSSKVQFCNPKSESNPTTLDIRNSTQSDNWRPKHQTKEAPLCTRVFKGSEVNPSYIPSHALENGSEKGRNADTIPASVSCEQELQSQRTIGRSGDNVVSSSIRNRSSEFNIPDVNKSDLNKVLPVLPYVLQAKLITELYSQSQAITNLIEAVSTVQILVVGGVLKTLQSENQTQIKSEIPAKSVDCEVKDIIPETKLSGSANSSSSLSLSANEMAARGGNSRGRAAGEMGNEDIQVVPDFNQQIENEDMDADNVIEMEEDGEEQWGGVNLQFLERLVPNGGAHQHQNSSPLEDEFASRVICDPEELAAILNGDVFPVPPPYNQNEVFLIEEEEEMIGLGLEEIQLDLFAALGEDAANAA